MTVHDVSCEAVVPVMLALLLPRPRNDLRRELLLCKRALRPLPVTGRTEDCSSSRSAGPFEPSKQAGVWRLNVRLGENAQCPLELRRCFLRASRLINGILGGG